MNFCSIASAGYHKKQKHRAHAHVLDEQVKPTFNSLSGGHPGHRRRPILPS